MSHRPCLFTLVGIAVVSMTIGCSSENRDDPAVAEHRPAAESSKTSPTSEADMTDLRRSAMTRGLEAAYKSRNAKARWEGDVLHLRIDAPPSSALPPGWQECRVIMQSFDEDPHAIIELPDATLACADVLAD